MNKESPKSAKESAAAWLARRDAGDWTSADQACFERWLNETPLHRISYLRIERAWERALRLKALGAGVPRGQIPRSGHWASSPFFESKKFEVEKRSAESTARGTLGLRVLRPYSLTTAATLLLAVVSGGLWAMWPSGPLYQTPIGGFATVPMPDGSKVSLNTDSAIRVKMSPSERQVELKRGEAFFEVTRDPKRPFVVRAGNARVVAVGTKFSVRRDAGEIQVVVTEGQVRVESESSSGKQLLRDMSQAGSASVPREPLNAGSIVRTSDAGIIVENKPVSEAERVLSWRDGVLVFNDTALGAAAAEFNRYNERQIVINDPAVATLHVAGRFRATNAEGFVRLLEHAYALHSTLHGHDVVLEFN